MNPIAEDILKHYGMPKRSGRYKWGSGENPYQHSGDFLSRIDELKKQGFTYTDDDGKLWSGDNAIAKYMKLTTTQYRTQVSLAKSERRALEVDTARGLRDKGYMPTEIARMMGYKNESSIRSLLDEGASSKTKQAEKTADFLREQIDTKGMIMIGAGVERELNISKEKLRQAVYILEMEGYERYGGGVPQVTNPGKQTNIQVLCPPGTPHKAIYDFENVHSLKDYISKDNGETFEPKWVYPKSMDSNRIKVRYAEEGGVEKDGLVEIRRGVDDISLGNSHYSQVRILVDDDRYIKGMAVYSDDMPDGVDMIFNTNKKQGTPKGDVFKKISTNPDNPFGSLIKEGVYDPNNPESNEKSGQSYYYDNKGKKQLSLINKRADEGDWNDWKDGLPSQFLSKQSITLIKKQLSLSSSDKQAEFDDIISLTNPTVKKVLLKSFSDDCDSAAIHLQAASLPRQKYQVIIPIPSLKDNEIYAPNYKSGEKVALIRFPHGGTFEIPILTVNNKHANSKKVLGSNPIDAVGINSKVAERLSGADFDGDTVMIIPTGNKIKISSQPPLKGLEGFDTKAAYQYDDIKKDDKGIEHYYRKGKEIRIMKNTQNEMGQISNLITDMTLKGADQDELARAVRHSMVVIDAEKHKLDYKKSAEDNNIAALKKRYQGRTTKEGKYSEGASTLISKSKSETQILKRQGSPKINQKGKEWYDSSKPEGSLIWKSVEEEYKVYKKVKDPVTGDTIKIDTGKTKLRTQKSTKMGEADDAFTLVSEANTPQERAYAEYANKMKSLGNTARKEMVTTGKISYSASANKTYKKEVTHLLVQLNDALKNAPREREAQRIANTIVNAKKQAHPDMTNKELKKIGQQELTKARDAVDAKRIKISVSDREWEAIQAGAISENKLMQIINNIDIDELRQRATPRTTNTLSTAKINKIQSMKASGYSTVDIAKALNVSTTTIINHLK